MPTWAFERSVHSVRLMTEFAVEQGITRAQMLADTDLTETQLLDPAMVVTGQQELQVIRNLLRHLGHRPALGVAVGARYHFTTFGVLGLAIVSSPSVREALNVALQYFHLTFAFTRFLVIDTATETIITIDDAEVPEDVRRFVVERDAAALITVKRDFVPTSMLERLVMTFASDEAWPAYTAFFGVEPEPLGASSFAVMDRLQMEQPLQFANELALNAAATQCRQLLDERQATHRLTQLVRERLMIAKGQMPTMATVAAELFMTARTLRRHLADEGCTFIGVREEVRQRLADQYLAMAEVSIEQTADWLGYAEPSSFINAYKRWHGTTPHAGRLVRFCMDTRKQARSKSR